MLDAFRALEAHRTTLSRITEALPDGVAQAKPRPGAWSMAQILDHMLRVDRALSLDGAPMSRVAAATSRARAAFINSVMALPLRVSIPRGAPSIVPDDAPDAAVTLARWAELRATWSARLGDVDPNSTAFPHPLFGPFRPAEALPFLLAHHRHHDAQVRRTLGALGQPVPV